RGSGDWSSDVCSSDLAECGHLTDPQQLVQELVRRNFLTPFQAEQVLQSPAADLNLGSYRLLDIIGEGGMGIIFKAYHQRLNRVEIGRASCRDGVSIEG